MTGKKYLESGKFNRDDRKKRKSNKDGSSPKRRFDEDGDRPKRRFGRDDEKHERNFKRDGDRPKRRFDEDGDRPKRRFGRDDEKHERNFKRDEDRPKRRFDEDGDRPKRRFGRDDEKHGRNFKRDEDRPKRRFDEDGYRPKRRFGRDDEKHERNFKRDEDRPKRRFDEDGDRPKRKFGRDDEKHGRNFKRDENRPKRRFDGDGDRPKRRFDRDDEKHGKSYIQTSEPEDSRLRRQRKEEQKFLKKQENLNIEPEHIRLNKFIANSGVCSRREADTFIEAGLVTVNGVVETELGVKILATDEIRFNGELLHGEKKVYLLMNKPKGFVTTLDDPHVDRTVMDLASKYCSERIYPVGRLDKNTTGVLLFTNDGDLTKKLTHPSFEKKKIYEVGLDKNLTKVDMQRLADGVELEDGLTFVDEIAYSDENDKTRVGVEIHSGKNRIIRRMFEHLGYKVTKLDRVYFAGLTKSKLRRGECRFLTEKEISTLKMGGYE